MIRIRQHIIFKYDGMNRSGSVIQRNPYEMEDWLKPFLDQIRKEIKNEHDQGSSQLCSQCILSVSDSSSSL